MAMALAHERPGLTFWAAGMGQQPTARTFGDRTLAEDPHTVLVRDLAGTLAVNLNLLHALIRTNDSRCPNTGISKNNDTMTVMVILRAQVHTRGKEYCFLKSGGTPGSVWG